MAELTQTPLNIVFTEPSLMDVLNYFSKDIFLRLNCHAIATIQTFNSEKQTISGFINYKQTFYETNAAGKTVAVLKDYPPVDDCPAIILGGGQANLTFPISPGDEALLLFTDKDMDNWFKGSNSSSPNTGRLHSFADAVALVGLRSLARSIADYDTVRAVLRNANAMVGVGPDLIKISNNLTTLNTVLQNLITAIKNIQVDAGTFNAGGTPVTGQGAIASTSQSALSSVGTQLGGLLE